MDKFRFNNKLLKNRRRDLRTGQTESEKKLWEYLRNRRFEGLKFYRQFSIGGYILDFYCPKIRMGIELDGSKHMETESVLYDKERENILSVSNISIIRFWNSEVESNIEEVLEKIRHGIVRQKINGS